jgi:ABC-type multidrug transport system ATPase subunit
MSEKILKALMQLFAIIAEPESYLNDKKAIVKSFLNRQINEDLVREYLKTFENYYKLYKEKQREKGKRVIPLSSVRVLKICTEINEELTQLQKIVVLVQLLEYVKSDEEGEEITEQEDEFISTVADTFFITKEHFDQIKEFVLYPFERIPDSDKILVINNDKDPTFEHAKHIYNENLDGQIRILNIDLVNMYLLRYIGGSEVYLNSQLLEYDKVFVFKTGSSLRNSRIRPIYYSDVVGCFIEDKITSKIVYQTDNITYRFKDGGLGLHEINFTEESGRLVGIMGASGSGKSTLLNVLNGNNAPSSGEVRINGKNLHAEKDSELEGLIGYVPQDDLLIEELTVYQNLYYNAKLCFDNYTEEQIDEAVMTTLRNLGLNEIKDFQVGSPLNKKISGGQRKRLNIALELIREPAILFLDEPTSGLSSRDSENIMDLIKELTLKGKLIFVVIHQPSSEIFKMFDRLLILDTGGYLIYNGDPIESLIYFKSKVHHANWSESECHCCGNVNPEQVFNIVEANVVDEYGNLTQSRKISPKEWHRYYEDDKKEQEADEERKTNIPENLPKINFKIPSRFKQFLLFTKRDILSKLTNTQYLIINFLEPPLLAFLLSFIVKYYSVNSEHGYTLLGNTNIPVFIFMSVIVSIFIGLTVSAEEIIRDRKILKREAFLNLSWGSYLLSKTGVLVIISAIQALTFIVLGNSIVEIHGMYFEFWLILFSSWVSSNIMGLVISDSFKTVVTIYIIIPFLVIPQLILSGVIVKYEELNPAISSPNKIPFYGEIITARWAYEALAVHQFKENKYEQMFYHYEKAMSRAIFKKDYWIPSIKNKISLFQRQKDNPEYEEKIKEDFRIIRNEIAAEVEENTLVDFEYVHMLYPDKITQPILDVLNKYLNVLNKYYIKLYNKANNLKDEIISNFHNQKNGRKRFLDLKRKYHNERLEEFVTNSKDMQRIIEFDGRLYQKMDPVFLDPESNFIKAHFYAPRKKVFGRYIDTFWVNTIVIWIISLILYLILYYRLLRKLLEGAEILSNMIKR